MSKPANLPEGMSTLSPHLVCDGAAAAIEFYKRAFDTVEMMRLPGENGKLMHASVRINGASVMPAADMFWGDRYGIIEDPFGHRWSIATPKKNLSHSEIAEAARAAMPDYVKNE